MKTRLPDKEYEAILMDTIEQNKKLKLPLTYAKWNSQVSLQNNIIEDKNFYAQSYVLNTFKLITSISNHITLTNHPNRDMRLQNINGSFSEINVSVDFEYGDERAIASETNRGIIVGTSTIAEAITDNRLPGLIPHGIMAGQLDYRPEHVYTVNYNVTLARWEITQARRFINNSGAAITVNEIGLAVDEIADRAANLGAGAVRRFNILLIRDVLLTGITIPHTGQLTLTLTKFTAAAW